MLQASYTDCDTLQLEKDDLSTVSNEKLIQNNNINENAKTLK